MPDEQLIKAAERSRAEGIYDTGKGEVEVIQYDEMKGVTPEMLDWWWDHLDEGYHEWHPGEHISFQWVVSPALGRIGATCVGKQVIAGREMDAKVRYEDPNLVSSEYDHVVLSSILLEDDSVGAKFWL